MTGADQVTEAAQPGSPGIVCLSDGLAVTAPRVVCQFSCGAASAVATKLTDWECGFVDSLQRQIAEGHRPTEKQTAWLNAIWEKATARG